MKNKFRTKFEARRISASFKGAKKLTDPQYLAETTIEGIVRKYGIIPAPDVMPVSGDVSQYGDFQSCMERVNDGLAHFAALPSSIRSRFGNDPKAFYNWLSDPANLHEAVSLGLATLRKDVKSERELLSEIAENTKTVSPEGPSA